MKVTCELTSAGRVGLTVILLSVDVTVTKASAVPKVYVIDPQSTAVLKTNAENICAGNTGLARTVVVISRTVGNTHVDVKQGFVNTSVKEMVFKTVFVPSFALVRSSMF